MNFRKRLLVLFLLLTVLPFILLQINSQVLYIPTITNRVKALFAYNLQQKSENLRRLLTERVGLVSQVSYDQGLADIIAEINRTPDPTSFQRFRMLDLFSRFTINSDLMVGMGFIRNDGLVIGYDRNGIGQAITGFGRYGSVKEVMDQAAAAGTMVSFPTCAFEVSESIRRTVILSVFPSYDLATNRRQGFFYFLLNEATIQNVLNPQIDDGAGIQAKSFIYDSGGLVVSYPDQAVFAADAEPLKADPENPAAMARIIPELRGKPVGFIAMDIPKSDWTVCTLYDEQSLFSDRDSMIRYTLLVGAVFFVSAVTILWLGSRGLVKSFNALVEQIRVVGNRLDAGPATVAGDELEFLGEAFRRMQDRINGLVNEVNDRNAALLSLAEEQRLAEIRALEAQVNPHFLYNTLNTLNWIAIRNDQGELSQGLSDLADIMRYSISQIEVTASLEDETSWLRKYLDLQQLRFRRNFSYSIENRGVPLRFRIYKLLFQPLVENALVHGFDPNKPGSLLDIRFELDERGRLVATISDNGRGMADVADDGRNRAIGLSNLEMRISAYYRQDGSLKLTARPGGGTIATLIIPEAPA